MFASQLLRILQTIPSDAKKYDNRESVFDLDQSDGVMKETQNVMNGDSRSLRRGSSDNIAFGSKEIFRFDSSGRRTNPFLYESKGRDYDSNPRFANEFPTENDDRESKFTHKSNDRKGNFPQEKEETHVRERTSRTSKNSIPITEVEEFKLREGNESIDSWLRTLSSETNGKGKAKIGPENDKASIEESRDRWSSSASSLSSETNSPDRNISVQVVEFKRREDAAASSGIFERDAYLFGEKDTLECDIPELLVCYKEINYHIMGENFSIYGDDDDNSHSKSTAKGTDLEASASDEMAFSSSESADCSGRKEEKGGDLIVNMQSGSLFEDGNDESDLSIKEDLKVVTGENNSVSTGERADKQPPLEDVSLVDQKLPIQEFGTRSFLRSFLHSLDDHQTSKDIQLDDDQHMTPRKEDAEDRADLSAKEEPKENGETNSLCYESEVENGSITFKFSSSSPVTTAHILNQISDRLNDKSLDSESMLTPKDSEDENNNNPPDHNQVHCKRDTTVADQESSIKTNVETDRHQPFEPKNKNIDDQSQLSKTQESMTSLDAKAAETSLRQHEPRKSSCQESVLSSNTTHTELSANGLITYSGTIEHNGSQSVRSDGSATSTRSFAFPILQCEWDDSSPARMGYKADGRHLRKHKNSRSGLFCCGF